MTSIHKKFVIGLTGGIASGKSSVANFFTEHDIDIVSADQVAHDLMQPNSPLVQAIYTDFLDVFSIDIRPDSEINASVRSQPTQISIDRAKLRELIFSNPKARALLDSLTHPAIGKELSHRIQQASSAYVIAEIPLLIEAKMQNMVNRILVVHVEREEQIKRIISRDQVDITQAEKAIDAQLNPEERLAQATDIIHNSGSKDKLAHQVAILHRKYLTLAEPTHTAEVDKSIEAPFSGLELF